MVTDLLGSKMPSTILAGVIRYGAKDLIPSLRLSFWPVLWANVKDDRHSVAVLGCQRAWQRDSERMHLIYEVVEFVGRW